MKLLLCLLLITGLPLCTYAQVTTFSIDSSKLNRPLMARLDTIYRDDQYPRSSLMDIIRTKGAKAIPDSIRRILRYKDSVNLVKVEAILDTYGWQGPQDVGIQGSQALFLVIQHADLATQEKYLPVIRTAEQQGRILSSNLAILEDRVAMRNKQPQIYGSQLFTDTATGKLYVYPMVDPDRLEYRRSSMGLQSMTDYMSNFKLTWDLEAYKKELPMIQQILQRQGR